MLMVMFTRVNGVTIKLMALVDICILMVLNTKDIGKKTNSMDKAKRLGPMELNMKVTMSRAKKTAEVNSDGLMNQHTMANSLTTISTVLVFTFGQILASTTANGKITKCTEREYSLGLMEENTKVTTTMTRNRAMEFSLGLMVVDTKDNGTMVNNTGKESTLLLREKQNAANGKMARESNGSTSE